MFYSKNQIKDLIEKGGLKIENNCEADFGEAYVLIGVSMPNSRFIAPGKAVTVFTEDISTGENIMCVIGVKSQLAGLMIDVPVRSIPPRHSGPVPIIVKNNSPFPFCFSPGNKLFQMLVAHTI